LVKEIELIESIDEVYSPMSGLSPRIGSRAIAVSWSSTGIAGALNGDHGVVVFGQVHVGISNGGASCKENQKSNRESSFESFHGNGCFKIELSESE
jgi:hypothetical protein